MPAEFLEKEVTEGGFAGLKPYLNRSPSYIPGNEVRIFDFLTHEHLRLADRHGWIVMLHIPRPGRLRDPLNLVPVSYTHLDVYKRQTQCMTKTAY